MAIARKRWNITASTCMAQTLCLMPFRGSPGQEQVKEDWNDKIMHGSVQLGTTMLMGSDGGCTEDGAKGMSGCCVCLTRDTPKAAERAFDALARDGNIQMPLAETFWAKRFGMLKDQFGVAWMVNCLKEPAYNSPCLPAPHQTRRGQ
ncbi:hypothetical protein CSZ94_18640 [Janthinobacterium sp. ROICE36]|uniref:VOC family protein n=1 Tax=Janthinobacterium sp. ROICE36 TaxID=2048670 RepID=UPI000C7F39F5|nr:VOC family protein [Janthinobacterium sp. ROICE36]PLY40909.1 hypothetical protein CSZ94_18640 [Janthinobacterium sp. ROICE36]